MKLPCVRKCILAVFLAVMCYRVKDLGDRLSYNQGPYRAVKEFPPSNCTFWSDSELETLSLEIIRQHQATSNSSKPPKAIILIGGSGAGKSSYAKQLLAQHHSETFILHGLDEYLKYSPEYPLLFLDALFVYLHAAEACYPSVIPLAKAVLSKIIHNQLNLVYEETGKNTVRLEKVINRFIQAGYSVEVVHVHSHPNTAVVRSKIRFLESGRFASEEYVRGSFPRADIDQWLKNKFPTILIRQCSNDCLGGAWNFMTPVAAALEPGCLVCLEDDKFEKIPSA